MIFCNNVQHVASVVLYLFIVDLILLPVVSTSDCQHASDSQNESDEPRTFLWTLNNDPPSYFFGTIHVPYTHVWDSIPHIAKQAFKQADEVFFELDLTDSKTTTNLANCQLLEDGKTLRDVLDKGLYKRIRRHMDYLYMMIPEWLSQEQKNRAQGNKNYLAEYQYRSLIGRWNRMKPIWLMLTLNSLTDSDIKSFGTPVLDLYLLRQAVYWGKKIGAIEQVMEQCEPLSRIPLEQVVVGLNQTLTKHERYKVEHDSMPSNDDLVSHYKCGNLNSVIYNRDAVKVPSLSDSISEPQQVKLARQLDEYFQSELLVKRNRRMAKRIAELIHSNEDTSFFFAFGAGHFLGDNSIIELLIEEGLNITHTRNDTSLPISESDAARQYIHLDNRIQMYNHPYIETMRKLNQATDTRRHVRHGRFNKKRKHEREEKEEEELEEKESEELSFDESLFDPSTYGDVWVRIDSVESMPYNGYLYRIDASDNSTTSSASSNIKNNLHIVTLTFTIVFYFLNIMIT